jgi:hypothetical protein
MSSASNLGYENIKPFSNINPNYANVSGTTYVGNFGSNEIPTKGGGAGTIKRKIKNITKQYKRMKRGSRKSRRVKRTLRKRFISRKRTRTGRRRQSHRGGYHQFSMSNVAGYSLGGDLSPSQSALANPPPFEAYKH